MEGFPLLRRRFVKFITIKTVFVLFLLSFSCFSGTTAEATELLGVYPPRINASTPVPLQNADTIRVVAIRVEFQTDTLSGTTGDGSFGDVISDTIEVDPLPHNRKYFQDQLLFLKHFYEDISYGEVFLDTTNAVYPLIDSVVYTLPYPMWHYNHNDEDYLDYGLASLYYDAWIAADEQNDDIDFSAYNPDQTLYIVFHAGVGKDFAFDYDPTPFDIPSAYMATDDLVEAFQNPFLDMGIPVDNATAFVKNGIILPECESQEGYELGMHGHMVLLMGYHIGMPNLFNTETGASVLGWFGMMDQGSGKLDGLVPAPPSAWMKHYMGWTEAQEVTSFPETISIPVGTIIKIPITSKEYFLVENIDSWVRPEVSWDSLQYSYYKAHNEEYPETFALLRDSVSQYMTVEIDPVSGVLTDIENWGVGRPASGILIWHIDENVIDANIADGTINNDPDNLGVYLEEADGAMDIGQDYGFFSAGYGTELGYQGDAFWGENEFHLDANPHKNTVTFGDDTFPDAKSNSGALSHLVFKDFSLQISDTMSFVVENDIYLPGFPKTIPGMSSKLFPADINGQGGDELFYYNSSTLYGWDTYGAPLPSMQGSTVPGHIYTFMDTTYKDRHAAADIDNDGMEEFFIASLDSLYRFSFNTASASFILDAVHLSLDGDVNSSLMINSTKLYFSDSDSLYCWDVSGSQMQLDWSFPGVILICLAPDNSMLVSKPVFLFDNEYAKIDAQGTELWSMDYDNIFWIDRFSCGDIDNDGEIEFIGLAMAEDFPPPVDHRILMIIDDDGTIIFEKDLYYPLRPVMADFEKDGHLDVLTVDSPDPTSSNASNSKFTAFHGNGSMVDYFPWNVDVFVSDPLLLAEEDDGFPVVLHFVTDEIAMPIPGNLTNSKYIDAKNRFGDNIDPFPISFPGLGINTQSIYFLDTPILFKSTENSVGLAMITIDSWTGNSTLYALDTGLSDVIWGSYNGNKGNTNCVTELYAPMPQTGSLMPSDQVYNWPNPNNPGEYFTNIRYYLNYDANIKIDIYDMAGDKVDELDDYGIAQAYNESVWNLDNISSGVYFARVEANGNGQSAVQFIKIAVMK